MTNRVTRLDVIPGNLRHYQRYCGLQLGSAALIRSANGAGRTVTAFLDVYVKLRWGGFSYLRRSWNVRP